MYSGIKMDNTPKNQHKHELRQKLESMKKAYAKTLRKVQKSEKANRARCYVQQKLAEQRLHDASNASPSCTHRLKNTSPRERVYLQYEKLSLVSGEQPKTDVEEKPVTNGDGSQSDRSSTRRMQRKRQSVSFSIPNEDTPESSSAESMVGDADGPRPSVDKILGYDEASESKMSLHVSPKSIGIGATAGHCASVLKETTSKNDGRSTSGVTDQNLLVVPESQFMDVTDLGSKKRTCETLNATTCYDIPDCIYGNCEQLCASGNQNVESGSFTKDNSNEILGRRGDRLHTPLYSKQPEDDSTSSVQEHTTKMQTKRARRKSRRRSKHPREVTVSDISMKEVVESQSTEDGSHTWIEGLMFPAEYYVRRTRSMTSGQGENQDSEGPAEYKSAKPVIRKASLIASSEGSPHQRVDSFDSDKILTDASESVVQSDSDSSRSQLSESVLKTVPVPPLRQERTDKDLEEIGPGKSARSTKSRRLPPNRSLNNRSSLEDSVSSSYSGTSILKTQNGDSQSHTPGLRLDKSVSNSQSNAFIKSQSEYAIRQFRLATGKIKLPETDFMLPEDDFGVLKLVKSQSTVKTSTSTSNHLTARTSSMGNDTENVEKPCCSKDGVLTKSHLEVSQTKRILDSQLSPTQYPTDCNLAPPVPHCSPGWSPTCTPHVSSGQNGTKAIHRISQKMCHQTYPQRTKDEDKENLSTEHLFRNKQITCSMPRNSPTNLQTRFPSNIPESPHSLPAVQQLVPRRLNNSKQECGLSNSAPLLGQASYFHKNRDKFQVMHKNAVSTYGNTTPPNIPTDVGPVDTKSNINQVSPFAGVATASPHGRAEEPKTMSQCEVTVSEDDVDDNTCTNKVGDGCSERLVLMGCFQHDIPWEASPTARDVTGGKMNIGEEGTSLLAVLYQRSLVIWWNSSDTTQWQILQSWVLKQEEEFNCVRFLPCTADGKLSLVVTGRFVSCSVKLLRYDAVTKETWQLNVNLGHSNAVPAPYLLCPTHKQRFAVAVRGKDNISDVYLVRTWANSSDIEMVKLSTGMDAALTSLLLVDGVEGLLVAITSDNHILLWNYETGELLKDVLMDPLDTCRQASCLKATAKSGLLFLIVIFRDDRTNVNPKSRECVGATVVLNPLTDRMVTLAEYQTSPEHMGVNLIEGILHGNSLLVQLSDGSLHQWNVFTGTLMNYSSGQPTGCTLRSASLCKSDVAIIGADQCQRMYGSVQVTS